MVLNYSNFSSLLESPGSDTLFINFCLLLLQTIHIKWSNSISHSMLRKTKAKYIRWFDWWINCGWLQACIYFSIRLRREEGLGNLFLLKLTKGLPRVHKHASVDWFYPPLWNDSWKQGMERVAKRYYGQGRV